MGLPTSAKLCRYGMLSERVCLRPLACPAARTCHSCTRVASCPGKLGGKSVYHSIWSHDLHLQRAGGRLVWGATLGFPSNLIIRPCAVHRLLLQW